MANHIVNICGNLGVAILIFISCTWILAVRVKLEIALPTIFGSFVFTCCSILFLTTNINNIYSLIVIPLCYISIIISAFIMGSRIPIISQLIIYISQVYASIIRIGIDPKKIEQEYANSMMQHIKNLKS